MPQTGARPRVVVGAGFGGLEAARGLARSPVDVTVIVISLAQPKLHLRVCHARLRQAYAVANFRQVMHPPSPPLFAVHVAEMS